MMRSDGVFTKPLGEVEGDALGKLAGVNEDQRRVVLVHKHGDAVVNLIPHLMGGDGAKRDPRYLDREVEFALVTNVDDHGIRATAAGKKMCDLLDGLLRCG